MNEIINFITSLTNDPRSGSIWQLIIILLAILFVGFVIAIIPWNLVFGAISILSLISLVASGVISTFFVEAGPFIIYTLGALVGSFFLFCITSEKDPNSSFEGGGYESGGYGEEPGKSDGIFAIIFRVLSGCET